MSTLAVGIVCALAASLALNGGFLLQHAGAATAEPITPRHPLRTLRSLLGAPAWTAGAALGTLGWALHITALTRAPLSLVQAFVAGGVALTVPLARWWLSHPVKRWELSAVIALAAGLALLGTGISTAPAGHVAAAPLAIMLGATAAVSAMLAGIGAVGARPGLMAAGAGLLYGGADIAIKVLTSTFTAHGAPATLRSPWLAAAAVLTAGAFFMFQRALQHGRPVMTIGLMTAGTYVLSIGGGVAVLGDRLGHGAGMETLHGLALAVVVAAACLLAGSQAGLAAEQEAS